MGTIDIGILVILGLSAIIGLVRGITKEFFGLVSWIGAGATAYFGYPFAEHLASSYIKSPTLASAATYVGLFIVFLVLFSIFSQILSSFIRSSGLGGIDRSLGFGFGIVRGVALLTLIEIGLGFFVSRENYPPNIKDSKFANHVYQASDAATGILPESLQNFIRDKQNAQKSQNNTENKVDLAAKEKADQEQRAMDMAQLRPKTSDDTPDVGAVTQTLIDAKNSIDSLMEGVQTPGQVPGQTPEREAPPEIVSKAQTNKPTNSPNNKIAA